MAATKQQRVKRRVASQAPAPLPTFNFEARITERARALEAVIGEGMDAERRQERRANAERSLREQFAAWQHVGNIFADALENKETSEEARMAIWAELDELNEAVGDFCATGQPQVVRLVYPLWRDLLEEQEGR